MSDDAKFIEGTVEKVVFANPENGWAVVDLLPYGGDAIVKVSGSLGSVAVDDCLRIVGTYEEHRKFGRQFRAESAHPATPRTEFGIFRYLSGPRVDGIGPELARRIVEAFGSQTFEVLDKTPERLHEVAGIGKKRTEKIMATWKIDAVRREGLVFLHSYGLGTALSERVLDALGADALSQVRTNPYIMVERVTGVGFKTADAMARTIGIAPDSVGRVRAGITYTLDQAQTEGHLCLPGKDLIQQSTALLEIDERPVRLGLKGLTESGRITIAEATDAATGSKSYFVYTPWAFQAQFEAAQRVRMLAEVTPERRSKFPSLSLPPELSDEQKDAVRNIMAAKVSILTGGPGVGKTTVLRTLTKNWIAFGQKLALGCPTGRAAKRLEEVSGLEAKTIHRLLKWNPHLKAFEYDASNCLEADVVVIDEASMLDLPLFVHLLRAIRPDASLVLVGDSDQLPSVGPGRVLGDLIDSGVVTTARLTRIFRQDSGSSIVTLAHAILKGLARVESVDGDEVVFVEEEDPVRGVDRIREICLYDLPSRLGMNPFTDIQILSPTNKGACGTVEINRMIQDARKADGARAVWGDHAFCRGDRVMQIRNDYDRELYNGDFGAVVDVIDSGSGKMTVVCDFDGRDQRYSGKELADLCPAWAITVHKSQGGEFRAVVMAVYPHHFMLLRRQVLYTGITRARELLVIVGSRRAFHQAVSNNRMAQRFGHLTDELEGRSLVPWMPPATSETGATSS